MDLSKDTVICRFCLGKFTKNCALIGEVVQHTLNFLILCPLITLQNLTISDNPMMCETCAASLSKCFDFKVKCLSAEDSIASFAESEAKKVDLQDIYSKVKLDGNIDRIPDDHSVCRFCLELVKDDASVSIRHDIVLIEILQKYFLEVDLKITEDVIACTPCFNSLQFCGSFISSFMNTEERIGEYCQVEGLNYKGQVDLRDVETFISKSLLNVEEVIIKEEKLQNIVDTNVDCKVKCEAPMDVEQEEKLVDKEVQQENSNRSLYAITMHKCDLCDYKTKDRYMLKRHMLVHKTPLEITMYKCERCTYETKHKDYLPKHMLVHKDASEIEMYICAVCSYKAKWKSQLRKHLLSHRNTPDAVTPVTLHKCDLCDYKTKQKPNVTRHMLTHKSPSERTMYKCELCTYGARHKETLQRHMLDHTDKSKIEMYKCELCTYETRRKECLQRHMRVHHTNTKMHKCDVCPFNAKWKRELQKHLLTHEVMPDTMYKCDFCKYEGKQKSHLRKHIGRCHKIPIYKCLLCDYETKQKSTLITHMLVHKNPSEITGYKCDLCDYEGEQESDLKGHILTHSNINIIKHELLDQVDVVKPEDAHTDS